ncbi:MAG: hypothetical protein LBQ54_11240 [Planctomycetaceae bacterium]|jgi:hypothetical protein|nr:hypothetical protein [Planctomycetaceae bacterium]
MDRIESYIEKAFEKFEDIPEIRAQKEEMTDHLRDRIHDAIHHGMSEKEAFHTVTAQVGESMADLEQTLQEYLRPEYRNLPEKKTSATAKPQEKVLYVNLYRYHRSIVLLLGEFLTAILLLITVNYRLAPEINPDFIDFLLFTYFIFLVVLSLGIILSVLMYVLHPFATKRVTPSVSAMLKKFFLGFAVISAVFVIPSSWPGLGERDFVECTGHFLWTTFFYTLIYFMSVCLGWWRLMHYTQAPHPKQDAPLIKTGLIFAAVLFPVLAISTGVNIHGRVSQIVSLHHSERGYLEQIDKLRYENHKLENMIQGNGNIQINRPIRALVSPAQHTSASPVPMGNFDGAGNMSGMDMMSSEGMSSTSSGKITTIQPAGMPQNTASYYRISPFMMFGMKEPVRIFTLEKSERSITPPSGMGMELPVFFNKEHKLSFEEAFPAEPLDTFRICRENNVEVRPIPFAEWKQGKIMTLFKKDESGKNILVRTGIANLSRRAEKLLLTLEYSDGLTHEKYPTGTTLFLDGFHSCEYREFETLFQIHEDISEEPDDQTLELTLRYENGLILDTCKTDI